jgi:Na+-transporting NADH:ubiquinone oxidoreductase subunit C
MQRDSLANTIVVAVSLCVVCSLVVSVAAVGLRQIQDANKSLDRKRNMIAAAGLFSGQGRQPSAAEVDEIFKRVEKRLLDLESGQLLPIDALDPETYDPRAAAKDPQASLAINDMRMGSIRAIEKIVPIFLVRGADNAELIEQYVFPVYGKGLWSTMYGYIALESDLNTIRGLTFYEHGETPGLGGEVDNETWKARWIGRKVFEPEGFDESNVRVGVARGSVSVENRAYEVDGLSGATITSRGVSDMLKFWFGQSGFGKFIQQQLASGGNA